MRRRSFLLALLLAASAGAARAQSLTAALVWLPPERFRKWSEVDALMRSRSDLKLAIGLTPGMATPLVKAALTPWVANGRIELAARIGGDPVLTVVDSHPLAPRPHDALERAVEAREKLGARLGLAPTGLIAGAGALDAGLAASLGASGAAWILAGPYAEADAPWAAAGKALFVPARPLAAPAGEEWSVPGAGVFDESAATASIFLAAAALAPSPREGWATPGELAAAKSAEKVEASAISAWTAWNPEAAATPPADESARAAWDAYGEAAAAFERYQNSGAADLRTLDGSVELLRRAQAARYFRPAPAPAEGETAPAAELPAELRKHLLAFYKRLKVPAPDSLYASAGTASASATGPAEGPTGVKALSGPGWIEFRAPAGSIALAPLLGGATAPFGDGGTLADPWRLRALRVEWDDQFVRATIRVGRALAGPPRPVYEIYADFNRVLGAGRTAMLEGRGAVVMARDAWELALSIAGEEARLYRARGGGEPEEIAALKADWSAERGEVRVSVPRALMRGSPARWGWALVALAEDPARPGRRPAASLVAPDGAILLGVLAPVETQKAVLGRSNSRVPAARLNP